ncbi:MAG: stage V sporulation protein R [Porticoccaceae bacterium]|nr:stage V sporulation protein R [Porticoccaceae bacterium]
MGWRVEDLKVWDDKIIEIASNYGLDWYPINYEVCDYYSMIGHMSYHGMPTHYDHWSYGKTFERTHQAYNAGVEGLPYELIINSNPSIAYLMRENPLYLQILIMAHCVGHSDFFKNNRMFSNTRAESVIGRFRAAKKRIQEYVEDPYVGIEKVEEVIDACHALQYQVLRDGSQRKTHEELVTYYKGLKQYDSEGELVLFDLDEPPLEPDGDIMGFISEHAKLPAWKRDVIEIVRDEAYYFMPQIQTKIMNEGWASYWHYTICHDLELSDEHHIPFLRMHNAVIRPHMGGLNPYHLGFVIFQDIKERFGLEECFVARESSNDIAFVRQYLTEDLCTELNLFSWSEKKDAYTIDEISDEDGWKSVRKHMCESIADAKLPVIKVEEIMLDGTLVLRHEHDGRDLELDYADRTVEHTKTLWGNNVILHTIIENEPWEI